MPNMLSIQLPRYLATEYGVLNVLSFELEEALDQPYRLQLTATNSSADLNVAGAWRSA